MLLWKTSSIACYTLTSIGSNIDTITYIDVIIVYYKRHFASVLVYVVILCNSTAADKLTIMISKE